MPSDPVSWADKALALYAFASHSKNSAQESGDGFVAAGSMVGVAIMLALAVECAFDIDEADVRNLVAEVLGVSPSRLSNLAHQASIPTWFKIAPTASPHRIDLEERRR